VPQDFTLRLINASSPPVIRYSTWRPGAPADRLLDDQFVMNNAILASVGVGKRIVMESKTADQVCMACMPPRLGIPAPPFAANATLCAC